MENDSATADLPETGEASANALVDAVASSRPGEHAQTTIRKRAQALTKKKLEFISSLNIQLDTLIYVELCIVYYMDCSFFRLILRALCQMMFLTPKPAFIPPAPQHRPYIGAIFGPNIICMLLHIFTARPEAGEAMRGYLHGGVIIDLIGQKGPTSKLHVVLLDVLILLLQCFMLAVHIEKERVQGVLNGSASSANAEHAQAAAAIAQDHDAEERGIMRDDVMLDSGMELQPLTVPAGGPAVHNGMEAELDEERERLLAEPSMRREEADDDDSMSTVRSGMAILAEFHVIHNLRRQWNDYGNATGSALQTVGFNAEFANVVGRRRFNEATARFQRGVESLSV